MASATPIAWLRRAFRLDRQPVEITTKAEPKGAPFQEDGHLETKTLPPAPPRASDLFPIALARDDVATSAQAGAVLSQLLGVPELERSIAGAAAKVRDRARFEQSLASFALIADAALTMLDYRALGNGWDGFGEHGTNYPETRAGYRERAYRPDFDRRSQPRRDRSQLELTAALQSALAQEEPQDALDRTLADSFIAELGIDDSVTKSWKPNVEAISSALDRELLIPLRALADATLGLDHRGVPLQGYGRRELDGMCRSLVEEMTRHIVEGDFEEWRFTNEQSRVQLACLAPEQLEAYRAPLGIELETRRGRTLRTRDEQGAGLFWVTKIGGPSHGFDMLSQCLLGLLANARNGAIVVDEEGYPDAARSVLRLLPTPEGKPVLYLEMLQVDFPHDERSNVGPDELRFAIIRHAVEKARAMNVDLVIAPLKEPSEFFAHLLGLRSERKPLDLVLHPSAGVFEASDSLLGAHHLPQTKTEIARLPLPEEDSNPRDPPRKPLLIHV